MPSSDVPPPRLFIVEDEPLQKRGLVDLLRDQGYDVVAECEDALSALAYLECDHAFALIMVDKQIPEEPGVPPQEGTGPNLLLSIKHKFRFIGPMALYTTLAQPNIGDIQRVYQIGASALAIPPGEKVENFIKALDLIIQGGQFLSPLFSKLGAGAVDPKYQCPLDPVEYYCARLISEHRGKEGTAEKWGAGISVHIVDELLDDIYQKLGTCIRGFVDLPKEKKQTMLAKWYYDYAVKLYGAAARIEYESRRMRRKKWPQIVFDEENAIAL
jgi:DNA-binding NarL/FixJ family response regulator